jgi:hypothetical protein
VAAGGTCYPRARDERRATRQRPLAAKAARIVELVLAGDMKEIAGSPEEDAVTADSLRELLALTIAVVCATEHM